MLYGRLCARDAVKIQVYRLLHGDRRRAGKGKHDAGPSGASVGGQPCPCETRLVGPGGAGAIATGAGGLAGGTRDCRARRATAVKLSIPGAGRPGQRQESASSRAEDVLHAY